MRYYPLKYEGRDLMSENNSFNNKQVLLDAVRAAGHKYADTFLKIQAYFNKPEVQSYLANMADSLKKLTEFTQHQKKLMAEMSKYGWFPSTVTFLNKIEENESFDSFMERCIVGELDDLEDLLYSNHPQRKIIIQEAFKLFKEERYIAAIPLFISQIDGLGEDRNLTPFFSDDPKVDFKSVRDESKKIRAAKLPKLLKHALDNKIEDINPKTFEFYREVIENAATSFILDRTPKVDISQKMKILNRNGIMHGHKDFLSYGTRTNALKVISLLLFVDHILGFIYVEKESE